MRRHKDPSRRQLKPGRQLKPRRPPQPRQSPQPPQARGRCTRYGALHPLRGGAPVTWRCTRTEEVHCLRIGCSAPTHKKKRGTDRTYLLPATTSPGTSGGLIVPHRRCPTASVVQVARSDSCCAVLILITASPTENSTPLILALTVQTTGPRHPPIRPVMPPPIPVTPPPSDVEVEAGHMTPPLICSHPHATPGTCPSNTTCPLPHTFFTRRSW